MMKVKVSYERAPMCGYIYTTLILNCNHLISHILYSYILIQLLCYPDEFLYNFPNILDARVVNRVGSPLDKVLKLSSCKSHSPGGWQRP
jgi:hypothetical protein